MKKILLAILLLIVLAAAASAGTFIVDRDGKWLIERSGRQLVEPSQEFNDRRNSQSAISDSDILADLDREINMDLRLAKVAEKYSKGEYTAEQRDKALELINTK